MDNLVCKIDQDLEMTSRIGGSRKKKNRIKRLPARSQEEDSKIPLRLSINMFSVEFCNSLTAAMRSKLQVQDIALLDSEGNPFC